MRAIIGLQLCLFGLFIPSCGVLACSTPFTNIFGVCLHLGSTASSWCAAQKYCSSIDGELVKGKNFLPLNGKIFPGMPRFYWIGMTDFLHERGRNRSGWRWSDGSLNPASNILTWISTYTAHDCLIQCHLTGKVCSAGCDYSRWYFRPLCQKRTPNRPSFVQDLPVVSIRVGLSYHDYAEKGGCSQLISDVNLLDCAVQCRTMKKEWCEAFYFNQAQRKCRLVLYTDATINMGDAKGWRKFVMKKDF